MDTEKKWPSSSQEKSSHKNSTLLALWSRTFSLYNREKCFCFSSHPVYAILWQQPHVRQLLCSWLCGSIPVSNLQALNTVISHPESNEAARCWNVVSLVLSFQSWIFLGSNLTGGEKLCTLKRFTGVVSFRFWNQKYTTIWPSSPTTGLVPRENHDSKGCVHPCPLQHSLPQPGLEATQMSMGSRMDKEDVVYMYNTMEYYSAIQRNKTGSFVETWMDLETVIQNEVRKKKTKIIYLHIYVESRNMIY